MLEVKDGGRSAAVKEMEGMISQERENLKTHEYAFVAFRRSRMNASQTAKTVKYTPSGVATVFGGIIGWLVTRWLLKKRKPENTSD